MEDMVNNINVYRRIALNGLDEYYKCAERKRICSTSFSMGDDGIQFGYELNTKMYEYAVQVIIFSALSLEAFANDFLLVNLGRNDYELLDKLDIKAKILIGTKMITQKRFTKDGNAYQKMKSLASLRNKLVHAKSVNANASAADIYIEIDTSEIENAVFTYKLVIEEIDRLAPQLKIRERYLVSDDELRDWYYLHV